MRRLLRRLLRPLGYQVNFSQERHNIDVLDLAIRAHLARSDVFFIQAGANDGLMRDPIRPYVDRYHWRGILVEPVPWLFERLKANYAAHPQLIFENVAISPAPGTLRLFSLRDDPALPDWARGLTSFSRGVLMRAHRAHPRFESLIQEIQVPCATLTGLLEKHRVPRLDLLQIDTEGYDFHVLQTLDFTRFRPTIIHFEHVHLRHTGGTQTWADCYRFLEHHGYALHTLEEDTLAILK